MTARARPFSLGGNGLPDRQSVLAAEPLIRPYLRMTPIVEVDAADFGLAGRPLTFKLEFLQHAGSFKARGPSSTFSRAARLIRSWSPRRVAITG